MSTNDNKFYIQAKVHLKGNTHEGGYCSDPCDMREIDTTTDEEFEVPNKQFIKDYCDSDGCIDYDGLTELSSETRLCSGSGYCGTKIVKHVTKGVLKMRRNNLKNECLDAMSSDEEEFATPSTTYLAPMPMVNSFRGRFNSTYTSNPSWYTSEKSKGDNRRK
tara:strand:- start:239 stop:724 length:486 start_codon:yes stop_codon:yes gene_type:complete